MMDNNEYLVATTVSIIYKLTQRPLGMSVEKYF